MGLGELPVELVLQITQDLGIVELNALAQRSRFLYQVLNDRVYQLDAQRCNSKALHWAARSHSYRTAVIALQNRSDVDKWYRHNIDKWFFYDETPLQAAIGSGSVSIVRLLLSHGARIVRHPYKWAPLGCATAYGQEELVKLFLDYDYGDDSLHGNFLGAAIIVAAERGHTAILKQLLRAKTSRTYFNPRRVDEAFRTAVHRRDETLIHLLVEAQLPTGIDGDSLRRAMSQGLEATVDLLIDHSADIHARGGHFFTELQAEAAAGDMKFVRRLLEKGAAVNVVGGHYGTAFIAALMCKHDAIMELLLEYGADVKLRSRQHGTAVEIAAERGDGKLVLQLLSYYTERNQRLNARGNALRAASKAGQEDIVRLLLEPDSAGKIRPIHVGRALCEATEAGHEMIAQKLLGYEPASRRYLDAARHAQSLLPWNRSAGCQCSGCIAQRQEVTP